MAKLSQAKREERMSIRMNANANMRMYVRRIVTTEPHSWGVRIRDPVDGQTVRARMRVFVWPYKNPVVFPGAASVTVTACSVSKQAKCA